MAEVYVMSNRLPITVTSDNNGIQIRESSGGLVSALAPLQSRISFQWIGWTGLMAGFRDDTDQNRQALCEWLDRNQRYSAVELDEAIVRGFYDGFSNAVIWPLFHYAPERVDFRNRFWDDYVRANEIFAQRFLELSQEDDILWVQDYHLMLVPAMVRKARPRQRIGFFLHIPFPSSEIYRLLPQRQEILRGVLGATVVGFHSSDYARHFQTSCLRLLGLDHREGSIRYQGRRVEVLHFPIGISPQVFREELDTPATQNVVEGLQTRLQGKRLVLGVDRLDYTKGIPQKLIAFESLLERFPQLREQVVFLQVGVPSREDVPEYQLLKSEIDRLVGSINGRFGTSSWVPIQYLASAISKGELCAMYARADVLFVNSLRDGMNLVSLEYVACQSNKDRPGVVLLSEFAGAAQSLAGAMVCNPWDIDTTTEMLFRSIEMNVDERRSRQILNQRHVDSHTADRWGQFFVDLLQTKEMVLPNSGVISLKDVEQTIFSEFSKPGSKKIFLDYDGTLVPFHSLPERAVPDSGLLDLLDSLSQLPGVKLYLISGRKWEDLDRWFGTLSTVGCVAEHGLYVRHPGQKKWIPLHKIRGRWKRRYRQILEEYVDSTPGSMIEEKSASLAWHYRLADPDLAEVRVNHLLLHLEETGARSPVDVIRGKKVIEIRERGVSKGNAAARLIDGEEFVFCAGDDETDEEMFFRLGKGRWTCRVGVADTEARIFADDSVELRNFLGRLATQS